VRAGVDWVQLREKDLEGGALLELALAVAAAARGASADVRVLVNRRLDVVLAAGLDGVHLGFDAVEPGAARRRPRERPGHDAGGRRPDSRRRGRAG